MSTKRTAVMRWLRSDLEDSGYTPYKEDGFWICRNCTARMKKRRVLCNDCSARKRYERKCEREEEQCDETGEDLS